MAYISKYSPRPGTVAAEMGNNVSPKEKKRRWKILNDILLKKWRKKLSQRKKIIVVLGSTASGKSDLAVELAKKFNGEIISADSRQVYKGMDIGTAKITKKEMQGVPHHLLDVASPKRKFTVVQYRKLVLSAINKILKKRKVPILCGGTGFYIQAVIDEIVIPEVKPDWKLRKKLEKKSPKELYKILQRLDPRRTKTIDKNNPRRLIRAIEIAKKTKKAVPLPRLRQGFGGQAYPVLMIGIKKEKGELKRLIEKRFLKWLRQGLIKEVKDLRKSGLSWKKIEEIGIHYRVVAQFLQNKIDYKLMIENSLKELQNYAKRQMTWFKRDKRIIWVKFHKETEKLVKSFLKTN